MLWWSIYVLCKERRVSFGVSASWSCSNPLRLRYPPQQLRQLFCLCDCTWALIQVERNFLSWYMFLTLIASTDRVLGCPPSAINITAGCLKWPCSFSYTFNFTELPTSPTKAKRQWKSNCYWIIDTSFNLQDIASAWTFQVRENRRCREAFWWRRSAWISNLCSVPSYLSHENHKETWPVQSFHGLLLVLAFEIKLVHIRDWYQLN